MAGYVGVLVSDPWLQNQFTQVELRTLKSSVSVGSFCSFLDDFCGDDLGFFCFFFKVRGDEEGERRRFEAGGAAGEDVQAEARRGDSHGGGESCVYSGVEPESGRRC